MEKRLNLDLYIIDEEFVLPAAKNDAAKNSTSS
jgi:hypothetical protein